MQESIFPRLLLSDVPVGPSDLEPGYLHPAHVAHGDPARPVELDDRAVAGEVGQEDVAHLPDVEDGLVVVAAGAEVLVAVGAVLHQDLGAALEALLGFLDERARAGYYYITDMQEKAKARFA